MAVTQAFNLANLALSAGGGSNVNVAVWSGNVTTVQWMNAGNINTSNITATNVNSNNVDVAAAINFSDGSSIISNASALVLFDYTGDGVTTSFSTGNYYATTVAATNVYMGGLYQRKSQYQWVGTNIIFNNPPPNQVNVEVQINTLTYAISVPSAGSVQPSTLTAGGPVWDSGGNLSVTGNVMAGGNVVASTLCATGNLLLVNAADFNNAGQFTVAMLTSEATLRSNATGTGTLLPMTFHAGGSERMRISTLGNVVIGSSAQTVNPTATLVINSALGGGEQWINANNGGGNISALSGGGLAVSTITGAIGAETITERLRITNTGNVGIGTANPRSLLQVAGLITAGNVNTAVVSANSLVLTGNITFGDGSQLSSATTTFTTLIAGNVSVIGSTPSSNGMYLPTANTLGFTTNNTQVMALNPRGNLGIGSSTPVSVLDLGQRTDAMVVAKGTTAQRPGSPTAGMLRYNTSTAQFEGYYTTQWNSLPIMGYNLLSINSTGYLLQDQVLTGDANAAFDVLNNPYISGFFAPLLGLSIDSLGNLVATY